MKAKLKAKPANALLVSTRKHLYTKQCAWSDDVYERIDFRCDPKLTDRELSNRLSSAIYKLHPSKHSAGRGYSCDVREVHRDKPDGGHIVIRHYCGIGD